VRGTQGDSFSDTGKGGEKKSENLTTKSGFEGSLLGEKGGELNLPREKKKTDRWFHVLRGRVRVHRVLCKIKKGVQ